MEDRAKANTAVAWPTPYMAAWSRLHVLFAVGTVFAWAHTIDEVRTGQLIALPFALANTAVLAGWSRYPRGWRIALSMTFGLLWIVTVIPFHVMPLIHGLVTWQNLSGITRVVGGSVMVVGAAAAMWKRDLAD